jgi:zeaxanthin glucosyltransferase
VTLLIISPDYASHLLPLATLGTAWRDAGERVVVATGTATASIVESFGFERVHLQLGRGSNPGIIAFQAAARKNDLLWNPVETARAVQRVVDDVAPDRVIVDHLAFSARLALLAHGTPYADVVLGHPSALPVGDEVYGYPPSWPAAFTPDAAALAELRRLCDEVSASFTEEWNAALDGLGAGHLRSCSAFAEHGDLLLFNYPRELHEPERTAVLPAHEFLGSSVRDEPADPQVDAWLASSDEPFVYVSFGSFLSVRGDVLARVLAALAAAHIRVAVAIGSADRAELGELPADWLVREFLPQVTLLSRAAAAVTHGGNNSVTEAMTHGVPLLVLPFSTDQFAGAAAIERVGFGESLDPNAATVEQLRDAAERVLALSAPARLELAALATSLRERPGRDRAHAALSAG